MPNPLRNHIAKLAAEAKSAEKALDSAASLPPPALPPPPPAKPKVEQWRHPMTEKWDRRIHEFSKRTGMATPPEEGMVRLYRAGKVPADSPPRSADDVINGPFGPLTRGELDAMKGTAHSNPFGAEGRWFTDEPKELDFYIRENDTDPVYVVDVPQDVARSYNVATTPYAKNSRNAEREFVLPDEALSGARRLLDGLDARPAATATATTNIAQLASEARKLASSRQHAVSHLSPNVQSMAGGLEQRAYGTSFARAPHERMSSPVQGEPQGQPGVVFAGVGGYGLDYANPSHRAAVDLLVHESIASGGTAEDAYRALREAGVQWVNNWNGIGEAGELYALDPRAVQVSRVFSSPRAMSYRFPRPDSELGIVVDGDWKRAATAGQGMPEARKR